MEPIEPYTMCSKQECDERIRTDEVSLTFERYDCSSISSTSCAEPNGRCFHQQQQQQQKQQLDPCKAVSKYRRSAAGSSFTDVPRAPPRSPPALRITVQYLVRRILFNLPDQHHHHHPASAAADTSSHTTDYNAATSAATAIGFLQRVAFFEDRMRAVQVDLVRTTGAAHTTTTTDPTTLRCHCSMMKELQCLAARSQILILYLLADCNSNSNRSNRSSPNNNNNNNDDKNAIYNSNNSYEHTFGQAALHTALSAYWNFGHVATDEVDDNDDDADDAKHSDANMDDEILSLGILVQLNQQLLSDQAMAIAEAASSESSSSSLWFGLTELYRKVVDVASVVGATPPTARRQSRRRHPLFQWSLQLVSRCCLGHWQSALSMLLFYSCADSSLNGNIASLHCDDDAKIDARFTTLARCIMAPSLHYIRWRVLQAYNVALLKNEAVSGEEVARVLCIQRRRRGASRNTATSSSSSSSSALWDDDAVNATAHAPLLSAEASAALELGRSFGLPVSSSSHHGNSLLFKVAPIQPPYYSRQQQQRGGSGTTTAAAIRDDDCAVLGRDTAATLAMSSDGMALPLVEWMERILF